MKFRLKIEIKKIPSNRKSTWVFSSSNPRTPGLRGVPSTDPGRAEIASTLTCCNSKALEATRMYFSFLETSNLH